MNLLKYGCRAGMILLCIVLSQYAKGQEEPKILDTHIHLYDTDRPGSFDFLDDHTSSGSDALRFPHLAQQFLDSASLAGVKYAYVVEASPRREDNFWLSEIADTSDCILGFSANLNPLDDTFVTDLDSLAKNPKFRGIRPRVTGIDLSDKTTQERFGELEKRNLVLELWGSSSNIATIAGLYPNMNIIVNHFAGGAVRESGVVNESSYKQKLAVLAAHKNVYLKISALYTLSGQNPAPLNMEYYKPLIDVAVDVFGPERVMFGSNWSLSGLRGQYKNMITILQEYCNVRNNLSAEQLFLTNAVKAYGLEDITTHSAAPVKRGRQNVYPVPANKWLWAKSEKPAGLEIYNVNGALVFANSFFAKSHKVSVAHYISGVYILRFMYSDGIESKKIIVSRN